ncbi:TonB-dependent receptor [Erythrobacter sp. T5W1-R]|uniref:TonB-dependent receptor n=1 Tax=Erythrobacter sp. T5W1-R TaxID=3101752 RepID=UPI002AFF5A48|nr:TonB-dependent receptor [Erythrobacter sp. T5W1-R]MEA1618459.1 TonB-dependent receptor [Erythrobacter sp. T5W1-R]
MKTLSLRHAASPAALVLSLALAATPALAADTADTAAADDAAQAPQVEDDLHNRQTARDGSIIVSAAGVREFDLLAGTSVLEVREIQREAVNGQIGDLLAKLPGVSSTSFAPGSSRPVLRGQQGERVRVLVDGLGTMDVSNTSVDHAVTIEPITLERVEVLRGPAVLLYGSQAIGGAVNVIDKRIPTRVPDEDFHFDALAGIDSASDMRNAAASLDVGLTNNLVLHVDGSWRKSGDLRIGGFQVAPGLRAELLEEAAEKDALGEPEEAAEFREAADQRGFVPNSDVESWTVNAGLGLILGQSTFGFAVGYYNTDYGVIKRPGLKEEKEEGGEEEEEGDETVRIGLEQFRADLKGDIFLGDGAIERLKLRVGYSDYTHTEFEGGEVGTVFDSKSIEARAELVQNAEGVLRGATGVQFMHRDFDAEGAEAYVPANLTDQFAIFTLQEYGNGPFQLEASARAEFTSVTSQPVAFDRSFETFSGALGLVYQGVEGVRMGINASRVERAPSAEELLSDGPHFATQAFEIGDRDLRVERAWGIEAFARGKVGAGTFSLAAYRQWFDNYIFVAETDQEEDGLPVFLYRQSDANFWGAEAELNYPLIDTGSYRLMTDLRASYVEADLTNGENVPRIPPLSLLGALEAQTDQFDLRGEVQWFAKQDRVAAFESETDSFALVNAMVAWRPFAENRNVTLLVAADNIFDVVGRRHASFTKDFIPLMGRNFRASVRMSF